MEGLRVSDLAERAGIAPSTVRFYERAGLLSPARRAENGYRVFEESALEELAFISRAKGIGMSLEDIANLVAAWPTGECQSLQARLRTFLAGRIGQIREQLAELRAFEAQLQAVLDRLSARDPGPERCEKGCSCETDLDLAPGKAALGTRAVGLLAGPRCASLPDQPDHPRSPMSTTAIIWAAAAAAGCPLLLWATGRGWPRSAPGYLLPGGRPRQYLAGRLYGVRVITVVACDGELLVSLAIQGGGPLAGVFRVTVSECSLARVIRWHHERTPLRGYLSQDGAIMLADPALGGNAACEPSITITSHTRERPAAHDQAPSEDK